MCTPHSCDACVWTPSESATHLYFLFYGYRDPRDLHSFPTRRSSDLLLRVGAANQAVPQVCRYSRSAAGGIRTKLQFWNIDRKSTRLNSSHLGISYAVFCLKKKTIARCRPAIMRCAT